MTRLTLVALLALIVASAAGGARQADEIPPDLVYVEDMTGEEFYIDDQGCAAVDVAEDAVDNEGGSGVHYVFITLQSQNWADEVIHDYINQTGGMASLCRPGLYAVKEAWVDDAADNTRFYDTAEMRRLGFHSTFWVYKWSSQQNDAPKKLRKPAKGKQTGAPADLAADDDQYVTMQSEDGQRRVDWTAVFTQVPNTVVDLTVTFRAKSSNVCLHRLWLRNFTTSRWELLDERNLGADEVEVVDVAPADWAPAYVQRAHGPGYVWARSTCEASQEFTTSTDVLTIDWAT